MNDNTTKKTKNKPVPRPRLPHLRTVKRAGSGNEDIIRLSALYFDLAATIEERIDKMCIHGDEKKRLQNYMYKFREIARSGGHFLEPKNVNALKTPELVDIAFGHVLAAEKARKAKAAASTSRIKTDIIF